MSTEKSNFIAFFDTDKAEIYGQTPFYFFRISANPAKSYYYKSYVNDDAKKEAMTDEEISYVFKLLKTYADKGVFQTIVGAIEDRYLRERISGGVDKKEVPSLIKSKPLSEPNKVYLTRHNNQNQEMRKAKQRDKQLAKYDSITPVVVKNAEGEETALCAKLNDEYFYVSLDSQKPAFFKVSLTKGTIMDVYEVGQLLEFTANCKKTEHIAANMALLYKAFKDKKVSAPSKTANEVYYSTVRIHLAKGLQTFSPVERQLCLEAQKRQR